MYKVFLKSAGRESQQESNHMKVKGNVVVLLTLQHHLQVCNIILYRIQVFLREFWQALLLYESGREAGLFPFLRCSSSSGGGGGKEI